jgi:hypothetical protein
VAIVPDYPKRPSAALAIVLLAGALALGACSGRDTKLAEAVAAAENAAKRAEAAAQRAEGAAKGGGSSPAPVVVEDEPEPDPQATETEEAPDEAAGEGTEPNNRQ